MKILLFTIKLCLFSMGLLSILGVPSFIEDGNIQSVILCIIMATISWFGFSLFVRK